MVHATHQSVLTGSQVHLQTQENQLNPQAAAVAIPPQTFFLDSGHLQCSVRQPSTEPRYPVCSPKRPECRKREGSIRWSSYNLEEPPLPSRAVTTPEARFDLVRELVDETLDGMFSEGREHPHLNERCT